MLMQTCLNIHTYGQHAVPPNPYSASADLSGTAALKAGWDKQHVD